MIYTYVMQLADLGNILVQTETVHGSPIHLTGTMMGTRLCLGECVLFGFQFT